MEEITKCFACPAAYHPASGHFWKEYGIAYCGPCYRYFIQWAKGHTKRKWGGMDFYKEAQVSCSARKNP